MYNTLNNIWAGEHYWLFPFEESAFEEADDNDDVDQERQDDGDQNVPPRKLGDVIHTQGCVVYFGLDLQ